MSVLVSGLSKHYGREAALAGIGLDVSDGEFLALLGPSGAGKTTLLRLIAGLDRPDAGTVFVGGQDVRHLSPRDRRIGFVFQNYALFRHMSVARNIAFGLTVKPRRERPSRVQIASRVEELLDLMQLSGLGSRFPAQLSGGQRQRAALARALAIDPQVLLLDEPFGALDAKVRTELREWLYALQRKLRLTTIFVTHDQAEAFLLADRIAILNAGRLEQVGTSAEIDDRPASAFVGEFLGAHRRSNRDRLDARAPAAAPREDQYALDLMHVPRQSAVGHHTCRRGTLMEQTLLDRPPTSAPEKAVCIPLSAAERRPQDIRHANPVLASDLPVIRSGECWLLVLPAKAELAVLERHALTTANVIVYDRTLATVVTTANLPLGGYAEPAAGDGLERCIQFARNGWSVVRLIEHTTAQGEGANRTRALVALFSAAGASSSLQIFTVAYSRRRLCRVETNIDEIDAFLGNPRNCQRQATVLRAFHCSDTPILNAVMSNGLAG